MCKIIFQRNILIAGLVVSLATPNQFIFKQVHFLLQISEQRNVTLQ